MPRKTTVPWVLLLAGGEGERLRSLTTTDDGLHIPKQFWSLHGGATLLQEARARALRLSAPSRVIAVVAAAHHRWWGHQLRGMTPENIVVQPRNCGTAVGILLPLLHMLQRDPDASVVLLPTDHHIADGATLERSIRGAMAHVQQHDHATLLGIEPHAADSGLGYIVPATHESVHGAPAPVAAFVEKPPASVAQSLIGQGALWNAFIIVARGASLLRLFERTMPAQLASLRDALRGGTEAMAECYRSLPTLDFSTRVLQAGDVGALRVLRVPGCGWTDLGTPERLTQTLRLLSDSIGAPGADRRLDILTLARQYARQDAAPRR